MTDWDTDFEALSTLEIVATRNGETLLTTTQWTRLADQDRHMNGVSQSQALAMHSPKAAFYSRELTAQH